MHKSKKTTQKDKDKEKENSNKIKKEQKQKIKNIIEKNKQLPSKTQINPIRITKAFTGFKKYNKNIIVHNSISSKEEVKKRLSPSNFRNRQNNKNLIANTTSYSTNKFISSNHLFLTNDIEKKGYDDKKIIKKNKNLKNYSNGGENIKIPDLNALFKKNKLKKTIIIDEKGNNNLNLKLEKGIQDYKNILNKNSNNNTIISNSFTGNTETNSLFINSRKSYMENYNNNFNRKSREDDIKQTIIDKNEEEKRLKEYNKIFNLLNSNIEQFKKMFNNNINNYNVINDKNKIILIKDKNNPNNKYKKIESNSHNKYKRNNNISREKKFDTNLKKNLSEKNLLSSNKFNKNFDQNFFPINPKINNDLSNNCSFLESSIQDDFYQSLLNQTFLQNISKISFEMNFDSISNSSIGKNNNNKLNDEIENNKKENIIKFNTNEKNINKQNNFGNSILMSKSPMKNRQIVYNKNNDLDKENNLKIYSNGIDKNNCIII